MTQTEQKASELFSEKFGTDLISRFSKLKEETKELFEAFDDYMNPLKPNRRPYLIDEISDVQAVLSHIQNLLNTDCESCLIDAIIKTKIREKIPNYKKDNSNGTIYNYGD